MPRANRIGKSISTMDTDGECHLCTDSSNQFLRHVHFLKDSRDIQSLRNHLTYSIPVTAKGGREHQESTISSLCEWRETMEKQFRLYPYADENGTKLFLWEWYVMDENRHIRTREDLHARMKGWL